MTEELRTPPHDSAQEQIVLGAMLTSPDAVADVQRIVTGADFYRPAHGQIFDTIAKLYARAEPTDVVAVTAALLADGHLANVGGAAYLQECMSVVPIAANATWHARKLVELSAKRRLIEVGTRIVRYGYDPNTEAADAINLAQFDLHRATVTRADHDPVRFGEALDATLRNIEQAGQGTEASGIQTGLVDLDRLLGGFRPGWLAIVAGRPGMGKTTYALDLLRHTSLRRNRPAAIFSLEMSRDEIIQRILSAQTSIPFEEIRSGKLNQRQWDLLAETTAKLYDSPLYIDDSPNLNLAAILAKSRRLQQQRGLDLVVVDYLQLMTSASKPESRVQEVGEISRGLKLLARELGCPVIAAAQLNRGPEQRVDKLPNMADLRESGSVENDADVVILMFRPAYYDKKTARGAEVDVIVAKNRHGSTDTVTALAQLHCARIVDMHRDAAA